MKNKHYTLAILFIAFAILQSEMLRAQITFGGGFAGHKSFGRTDDSFRGGVQLRFGTPQYSDGLYSGNLTIYFPANIEIPVSIVNISSGQEARNNINMRSNLYEFYLNYNIYFTGAYDEPDLMNIYGRLGTGILLNRLNFSFGYDRSENIITDPELQFFNALTGNNFNEVVFDIGLVGGIGVEKKFGSVYFYSELAGGLPFSTVFQPRPQGIDLRIPPYAGFNLGLRYQF